MAPSPETWVGQRLREGANTIAVPSDLTQDIVRQVAQETSPRPARWRLQVVAVVTMVAAGVVGFTVLRSGHESTPPPVADPTPLISDGFVSDASRSLLGTWELQGWGGERLHRSDSGEGLLVTFQTDGTWTGADECGELLSGTYRVDTDGGFDSTSKGTRFLGCNPEDGVDLLPIPAADRAVEVQVMGGTANFYDAAGDSVATYVRPGGSAGPVGNLIKKNGELALSLTTYGSSSCPSEIKAIDLEEANQLIVTMSHQPSAASCTLDYSPSTDEVRVPEGLDLTQPVTATLLTEFPPVITILVDTQGIIDPLLVTAKDWDGTSTELARLEGILGVNERGCVTVGGTVVMWPNTYHLVTDRADTWAIATTDKGYGPGYMNVLAAEGEPVVLSGGMTPFDVNPGPLPVANHSECLLEDDYWTGIIEVQAND